VIAEQLSADARAVCGAAGRNQFQTTTADGGGNCSAAGSDYFNPSVAEKRAAATPLEPTNCVAELTISD
jgi:hypothetical protein